MTTIDEYKAFPIDQLKREIKTIDARITELRQESEKAVAAVESLTK